MVNSADPGQLASSEANWSGSTLFAKAWVYLGSAGQGLTIKVPITTAADDNFCYFFFYWSEKTSLDISCESAAKQTIQMKCQDFFSEK